MKQIVISLYKKHQQEDQYTEDEQVMLPNQLISVNRFTDDQENYDGANVSRDGHLTSHN